jgi:hypothetical protein
MVWFRCACGHIAIIEPVAGEIVSAYHVHRDARLDHTAQVCRMEPLPDLVPEPVLATAGPVAT